jgi:hypothetical protein
MITDLHDDVGVNVACIGETISEYNILIGKSDGERAQLGTEGRIL